MVGYRSNFHSAVRTGPSRNVCFNLTGISDRYIGNEGIMRLSEKDSAFFFSVFYPLLYYSYSMFATASIEEFLQCDIDVFRASRDILLRQRDRIDDYIAEIGKKAIERGEPERLDLLRSIRNGRFNDFIAVEKNREVYFIDYHNRNLIYHITGLADEPRELFIEFPCRTKSHIFMFRNSILTDGLHHIVQMRYPKKAAKLILRDFELDFETNLRQTIEG